MRPTLRLWPCSSFNGTVRFFSTPWGGMSHTFTCAQTRTQTQWTTGGPSAPRHSLWMPRPQSAGLCSEPPCQAGGSKNNLPTAMGSYQDTQKHRVHAPWCPRSRRRCSNRWRGSIWCPGRFLCGPTLEGGGGPLYPSGEKKIATITKRDTESGSGRYLLCCEGNQYPSWISSNKGDSGVWVVVSKGNKS